MCDQSSLFSIDQPTVSLIDQPSIPHNDRNGRSTICTSIVPLCISTPPIVRIASIVHVFRLNEEILVCAAIVVLRSHHCASLGSILQVKLAKSVQSSALSMLSTTAMQYYHPAGPATAAGYPKVPYYTAINASVDQLPSPTFISSTPLQSPASSLYTSR